MNFIDHIRIECRSGKGGKGSSHLRREKYMPKGGPDGGDGGRGGHVILRGNSQLWTLLHLRYTKHVIAEDGQVGYSNQSSGAAGKDQIIEVPLGTVVKDAETFEPICEVTKDGEEHILFAGGRGGLGNQHFKTATNQTPRYAQPGEPGIEQWVIMELKVLADVGLVGFPNAGKSTLLAAISAAKPKVADYAFTTLTPNLGIVSYRDDKSFVMADIPGIIEGAHEGKGLGLRFLRHIERNSLLLFMVPADSKNIAADYAVLLNELKQYSPELLDKDRLLAITKCDMLDEELMEQMRPELPKEVEHVMISSVSGFGLSVLKDAIWRKLQEAPKAPAEFPEWSV
ncbi:MAG: GTPase ObgE [Flavobacteriales bacterium]